MNNPSFTIREITEVLGITKRTTEMRANRENWHYEEATGLGGKKRLYKLNDLPEPIQVILLKVHGVKDPPASSAAIAAAAAVKADKPLFSYDAEALWEWARTRTQKLRDRGARNTNLLRQAMQLVDNGQGLQEALKLVATANGTSPSNLKNWYYGAKYKPGAKQYARQDWDAALILGCRVIAEIPPIAWNWYCSYYLTRRSLI